MENHTLRFSISEKPSVEVSSSCLQNWGFFFFFRRRINDASLFVDLFFLFPRGDRIEPMLLEHWVFDLSKSFFRSTFEDN
jgi:hypothetical protein